MSADHSRQTSHQLIRLRMNSEHTYAHCQRPGYHQSIVKENNQFVEEVVVASHGELIGLGQRLQRQREVGMETQLARVRRS